MNQMIIAEIERNMFGALDSTQMKRLHDVLNYCFFNKRVEEIDPMKAWEPLMPEKDYVAEFIKAKEVEGCSKRTMKYYATTLRAMLPQIEKPVLHITTDDIRNCLSEYQRNHKISKTTVDNTRRVFSSFFNWLEEENYILKSPVRRIKKIRTRSSIKATFTDEDLEIMRDDCEGIRDLAIIDLLSSTGMRIGELVNLNIDDVDFENKQCTVLGKGDKEREVYFDARTKLHLKRYLATRTDNNKALFVAMRKPHNRLGIGAVETRLRQLGKKLNINRVHPHKFRRSCATRAIDKGMPIEQVQRLLGHTSIDTTLMYAMVDQFNVKMSHQRYLC